MTEPTVANALLRCTRQDDKAAPLFEKISTVPDLWVCELNTLHQTAWPDWLAWLQRFLMTHEVLLANLKDGSTDFTLHLSIVFSECFHRVTFPPSLSRTLADFGITVELYREDYS